MGYPVVFSHGVLGTEANDARLVQEAGRVYLVMASPGSAGNVIAALASFFIPGLGQLIQGRILKALLFFILAAVLWWFWLGWIISIRATIDAALFKRPEVAR